MTVAPGRPDRPGARAQATLEFALVFGLFLMMLMTILDAWFWVLETDAAVAAVEQGVGVALAAYGSPLSPTTAVQAVYGEVAPALTPSMPGTSVEDWYATSWRSQIPSTRCPTADEVADHEGVGHVVVCAADDGAGHVIVSVTGYASSMIPPAFGVFNWRGGGLPVAEEAAVDAGTYAP
jgi:hypothetical protein